MRLGEVRARLDAAGSTVPTPGVPGVVGGTPPVRPDEPLPAAPSIDPADGLRHRLRELFARVRRPTYRTLEAHADREGRTLRPSTTSGLLNGPATPKWDTVETFVLACARHARSRQIRLPADVLDLERWHAVYRDTEYTHAARRERTAGRPAPTRRGWFAVPAQLPPDTTTFSGRTRHLAELDGLLPSDGGSTASAVAIAAIDGTAGVGKTALAVHWAHRVRDRFPDGQLYVNLRGFDAGETVLDPAVAVRGFLDALEVPAQRIPADPEAQIALYRSVLADKRMLIVLDNARDTAQVRPLLPGASASLVLVTSRLRLTSLIAAHGAHRIALDLLTAEEARRLFTQRLGDHRADAEPRAVDAIVRRCARLPLALTLAAANAAVRSRTELRVVAEELRDDRYRWQTLTGDDSATGVRGALSWSYRALTPVAARMFRLIGPHPGPEITVPAAASLAAVSPAEARSVLTELTRANLLSEHAPDRYSLHDLLRAYAADLCAIHDGRDKTRAAVLSGRSITPTGPASPHVPFCSAVNRSAPAAGQTDVT